MDRTSFIVPHGHVQARAYICIPVQEEMATRSSVIASLMDCDGLVELPEGVQVSDVLTWAEFQPEQAPKLSTEQLSQALKVYLPRVQRFCARLVNASLNRKILS